VNAADVITALAAGAGPPANKIATRWIAVIRGRSQRIRVRKRNKKQRNDLRL